MAMIHHDETGSFESQWETLDEEVIDEFGRWLTLFGKVTGIVLFSALVAAFMGLL